VQVAATLIDALRVLIVEVTRLIDPQPLPATSPIIDECPAGKSSRAACTTASTCLGASVIAFGLGCGSLSLNSLMHSSSTATSLPRTASGGHAAMIERRNPVIAIRVYLGIARRLYDGDYAFSPLEALKEEVKVGKARVDFFGFENPMWTERGIVGLGKN
jgi:hypothetical protein